MPSNAFTLNTDEWVACPCGWGWRGASGRGEKDKIKRRHGKVFPTFAFLLANPELTCEDIQTFHNASPARRNVRSNIAGHLTVAGGGENDGGVVLQQTVQDTATPEQIEASKKKAEKNKRQREAKKRARLAKKTEKRPPTDDAKKSADDAFYASAEYNDDEVWGQIEAMTMEDCAFALGIE